MRHHLFFRLMVVGGAAFAAAIPTWLGPAPELPRFAQDHAVDLPAAADAGSLGRVARAARSAAALFDFAPLGAAPEQVSRDIRYRDIVRRYEPGLPPGVALPVPPTAPALVSPVPDDDGQRPRDAAWWNYHLAASDFAPLTVVALPTAHRFVPAEDSAADDGDDDSAGSGGDAEDGVDEGTSGGDVDDGTGAPTGSDGGDVDIGGGYPNGGPGGGVDAGGDDIVDVPAPATFGLFALGFLSLAARRRRRA